MSNMPMDFDFILISFFFGVSDKRKSAEESCESCI